MVTREDISSLPVPEAKFQEAKSDYLEQLIVTPEMVAKEKERKGTSKMVAKKMVAKIIKVMKDNKSPGVDGILRRLLKKTVEQISTPLAGVFNLSLKERVEWKKANII